MLRKYVNLFHIFFVSSLFIYIGIKKNNIPQLMYSILLYLGIFIVIFHLYKLYVKLTNGLTSTWINYIHIFLIGPLVIIIGLYGVETSRKYYEMLLMLGMASVGYHGYYLLN